MNLGTWNVGDTLYHKFNSTNASGIPTTLTGGAVCAYKDGSTTETTEGITLTADFDSKQGWNHLTINTAANSSFYGSGTYYLMMASGNVLGTSVVGARVGSFKLGSPDVYYADINYTVDSANSQDEYTVSWFKNGVPLSSGQIVSPTIQVIKRSDGSDLIATTSMQFINTALGTVKKDETTNRRGNGEAAIAQVQATIDGATRTWRRLFSRDN